MSVGTVTNSVSFDTLKNPSVLGGKPIKTMTEATLSPEEFGKAIDAIDSEAQNPQFGYCSFRRKLPPIPGLSCHRSVLKEPVVAGLRRPDGAERRW